MLLLTDEEVQQLASADLCLEILEQAYREQGDGWAGSTNRTEIVAANNQSPDQEPCYGLKSMMGAVAGLKTGAIRINSDIITWPSGEHGIKRVKNPKAPGNRYVGLVLLFSTETGELLSLFPDASIQRMRVGATSALGVKYLSRENSETLGIYGSGWQAGSHLMATARVRNIKKTRVYSPNWERCRTFCREMGDLVNMEVFPVKDPREIMDRSDIVLSCTNSLDYVIHGKWLREGMHICSVKSGEIDPEAYARSDLLVMHTRQPGPEDILVNGNQDVPGGLIKERGSYIYGFVKSDMLKNINWSDLPLLSDVIIGKGHQRESEAQISCFGNNLGLGIQFAAVGHAVYQKAKAEGLGKDLPSEWFSQLNHP
jgi:alanine dehydrogenase